MIQHLFAALVPEYPREGGIHALKVAVGRRQVYALLEGFEQLRKASFVFAIVSNIVRQNADSLIAAVANQRMQIALQESDGVIALELNAHDPGPVTPLQKARQGLFGGGAASVHRVKEFIEGAADQIRKGLSDQIGEAAVGGYDVPIERDREEQVVERVNQIAIAALGPLDQLKQFFQSSDVGGSRGSLLEPTHQPVQLGHLLAFGPSVDPEQADEQHQTGWESLLCKRFLAELRPGDHGQPNG